MFVAVIAIAFVSCGKDDDKKSDARDKFTGSYTYVMTGTLKVTYDGETLNEPISENGSFTIEKGKSDNTVLLKENGETEEYTVSGNTITSTYSIKENGFNVLLFS